MGLLERVAASAPRTASRTRGAGTPASGVPAPGSWAERYSIDAWIADVSGMFGYGSGSAGQVPVDLSRLGLNTTYDSVRIAEIAHSLPGYSAALRACPPAFAAQMVRALVISQTRFVFRNTPGHPRTPRRRWSSSALSVLETPWPDATTADLITRMEWHAGLAGNAYVVRRPDGYLKVLRPDWCALIFGSDRDPDAAPHAIDSEVLGLVYQNGGIGQSGATMELFLPDEFIHWAPLPDPESAHIGQAWITPAVRDMQGDRAATEHKLKFFANGATPNLVVTGLPADSPGKFQEAVEMLEAEHSGLANAYKTLYLSLGADAKAVGSDFQQMDFKATQGAGETRISFLSRVPAAILGIAEGLAGSSLNAGNFGMARRIFADSWVYPTLRSLAGSLAPLVDVPADSELWFDVLDVPLLREDAKDAAEITEIQARTIGGLVKEGFTPETAMAAVVGQDMNLLAHTGLVSVQLQPPGGPAGQDPDEQKASELTDLAAKLPAGVDHVITVEEARKILNLAGAGIPPSYPGGVPKPPAPVAPAAAPGQPAPGQPAPNPPPAPGKPGKPAPPAAASGAATGTVRVLPAPAALVVAAQHQRWRRARNAELRAMAAHLASPGASN
jgi:phage portal protein BeeE